MMRITNGFWAWSARPAPRAGFARRLHDIAVLAAGWLARARSRRALLALDARALRDIGVTAAAARREAARPFWR
jgi:uncharacterized protein YjiS (DUF1127 family)